MLETRRSLIRYSNSCQNCLAEWLWLQKGVRRFQMTLQRLSYFFPRLRPDDNRWENICESVNRNVGFQLQKDDHQLIMSRAPLTDSLVFFWMRITIPTSTPLGGTSHAIILHCLVCELCTGPGIQYLPTRASLSMSSCRRRLIKCTSNMHNCNCLWVRQGATS